MAMAEVRKDEDFIAKTSALGIVATARGPAGSRRLSRDTNTNC